MSDETRLTEQQAQEEMYRWAETQKDLIVIEKQLDALWDRIRDRRISLLQDHPGLRLGVKS